MMNEKLIDIVVRTISKNYSIHIEMCYKGDESYIEDLYFSENDIRRGGLDVSDFISNTLGIDEEENKIIIEKWINTKIDLDKNKYDINKLWFKTKNSFGGGFAYSGVTFFTGGTIVY